MAFSQTCRCVICYLPVKGNQEENEATEEEMRVRKPGVSGSSEIYSQLHVIFVLRKILEVNQETLTTWMKDLGTNPGEWIQLCGQCNEGISRAKTVYQELTQVQSRFRRTQQEILDKIKGSLEDEGDRANRRRKLEGKRGRGGDKDALWITDECRAIVQKQCEEGAYAAGHVALESEFLSGDLKAQSLLQNRDLDNFVKQERLNSDPDELDELIISPEQFGFDDAQDYEDEEEMNSNHRFDSDPLQQTGYSIDQFKQLLIQDKSAEIDVKYSALSNQTFSCSVCTSEDSNDMELPQFVEHCLYHKRYVFRCTRCSHRFPSNKSCDTIYHFRINHPKYIQPVSKRCVQDPRMPTVEWWCPICGDRFPSDIEREKHILEEHEEGVKVNLEAYVCQWCSQSQFYTMGELRLHEAVTHVLQNHPKGRNSRKKALLSKMDKLSKETMEEEVEEETTESSNSQERKLGYSIKMFQQLIRQNSGEQDGHLNSRRLCCTVCGNGKRMNVNDFLDHYLHHLRYRFKCTKCSHRFCTDQSRDTHYHYKMRHKTSLSKHPTTRTVHEPLPEIPWWCPVCPEQFSSYVERDNHCGLAHSEEISAKLEGEEHGCQFCSSRFLSTDELRLHEATSHVFDEKKEQRKKDKRNVRKSVAKVREMKMEETGDSSVDEAYESRMEADNNCDNDKLPVEEELSLAAVPEVDDQNEVDLTSFELPHPEAGTLYTKHQFQQIVKQANLESEKCFSCNICPKLESMPLSSFLEHYLYHKRMRFQCTHCNHRFPSILAQYTNYHYRQVHPEHFDLPRKTKCTLSPVTPTYFWQCGYCRDTFPEERLRDSHLESEHSDLITSPKETAYQCRCCFKSYFKVEELLFHLAQDHVQVTVKTKSEIREEPFRCTLCPAEFKRQYFLQNHLREEHGLEENHVCQLCGRKCKNEINLAKHLELHETKKRFKAKKGESVSTQSASSSKEPICCPLCNKYEVNVGSEEKLCEHLDTCQNKGERTKKNYQLNCNICQTYHTSWENKIELVHHMMGCQGKNEALVPILSLTSRIFQCSICTKPTKYMKMDAFLAHYLYHIKYRYKCTQCGNSYHSQANVNSHFISKHQHLLQETDISSRYNYNDQVPQLTWWCSSYCNARFLDEDSREAHVLQVHVDKSIKNELKEYQCTECSKSYDSAAELKFHQGTAHVTETSLFPCDQCSESFTRPKFLRDHQIAKHKSDLVICDTCGISLKRKNLQNHLQTHLSVKKYPCPDCEESFIGQHELKMHRFQKHGPRDNTQNPLVCPYCPTAKAFHSKNYLREHIKMVHLNVSDISCHLCGKLFGSQSKLQYHLSKIHKEGTAGQYKCPEQGCGKIFYQKMTLKYHLSVHRGEPGFECKVCKKPFYFRRMLKRHELIHTNAETKPYQCKQCGKCFAVQDYLKIHMKSHRK